MTGRAAAVGIDPFSDAFLADPYRFHGALRDAGSVVWLEHYGIYAMACHADKRDDPDRFDLRRRAIGHVGFGIVGCVGQMIARQEAELVLRELLARVATITLAGPPVRRLNNTLHALQSPPLKVTTVQTVQGVRR